MYFSICSYSRVIVLVILMPIKLVKLSDRKNFYRLTPQEMELMENVVSATSVEEAKDYSMEYVCNKLRFAVRNDIPNGKANCIGYAQLYAAVFNYCCELNNIKAEARPVVGYVEFWGINLCFIGEKLLLSKRWKSFVKDHDFVEIRADGRTLYVDASLKELIGRDCETEQTHTGA